MTDGKDRAKMSYALWSLINGFLNKNHQRKYKVTSKTFSVIGTNYVCLSDTAFKSITVIPKPSPMFTSNPNGDWFKDDDVFFASIDTSIIKWVWEINGQNLNINKPKFSHIFNC